MRTTGNDLTIVSSGAGMPAVIEATQQLQKAGMKVEAIDLRSLKPIDTATLVKSVQKTKRLLTFDQSYYTLCPGAELLRASRRTWTAHATSASHFPMRRHPHLPRCLPGCAPTPVTSWPPPKRVVGRPASRSTGSEGSFLPSALPPNHIRMRPWT